MSGAREGERDKNGVRGGGGGDSGEGEEGGGGGSRVGTG